MPYAQHLRITASGVFGTGPLGGEQWSWRLNLSDPVASEDPVDDQDQADDIAADVAAFHGRAGSWISANARLLEVKCARIGVDGKYLDDPRIVTMDQAGGGGALVYPYQVALAVSLGTERRGATGRGRFYLPGPTIPFAVNTGQVSAIPAQEVRDSVVQLVQDINDQPGLDGVAPRVVIASSKGYNSDVTTVRVGRVLDTIRSRRTSVDEAYGPESAV